MKNALRIFYILAAVTVLFNTAFAIEDGIFYDINQLPTGVLKGSVTSPDGNKTLNVYEINNSIGSAVRAEISDGKTLRNVYWQTDIKDVKFSFVNDNVISVDEVVLDITGPDVYDCRRGVSLFQEGSLLDSSSVKGNKK